MSLLPPLSSGSSSPSPTPTPAPMKLYLPQDGLDEFIKVRASLDFQPSVFWWSGSVYSFVPERPDLSQELFTMKGMNVGRAVPTEAGYNLLTREVAVYGDLDTQEPLASWNSAVIGGPDRGCEVVHVWNDPVNGKFSRGRGDDPFRLPTQELGNGMVCVSMDVFVAYPSPIRHDQFPEHSGSNVYQGAELFQFFCQKDHINDPNLPSAPASISWTRIGPWLPWMRMGESPGHLVYQCRGAKSMHGFEGVDPDLLLFVREKNPIFLEPPAEISRRNETSWTYFLREHLSH